MPQKNIAGATVKNGMHCFECSTTYHVEGAIFTDFGLIIAPYSMIEAEMAPVNINVRPKQNFFTSTATLSSLFQLQIKATVI